MTILLAALAVCVLIHVACALPASRARFPRTCGALAAAMLTAYSLLAGLLVLEFYFAKVYDQSDGFNLTRAGRVWFERHWKPVNALEYRDIEVAPPAPGQKSVVFLGDSFTAGHGVKDAGARFSDVAARALGPGWRGYNVAKIGWDTRDEDKALRAFPVKPSVVLLAYYLNDIFSAASEAKYPLDFAVKLPTGLTKQLLARSALADYLYWRFSRGGNLAGGAGTFWDALKGAYADARVWGIHAQEMADLALYCRENSIELLVVVFPMLQAPAESAPLTAKVAAHFESLGVAALDLAPAFLGRKPADLVVNSLDAHPSEATHKEVGELVAARLKQLEAGLPR
jgi:lysophospholipase L1-like esterase